MDGRSARLEEETRGFEAVLRAVEPWPDAVHLAIAGLMVAGLAVIDYLSGSEVSFSIFYLAPVAWTTWFIGRRSGFFVALVSAIAWGFMDIAAGARYASIAVPIWNAAVRLGFFVVVLLLLAQIRKTSELRRQLALSDALTGIANTRAFCASLDREIGRLKRYGRPFTLAYIDLDRFKSVNDTLGHSAGDELLRGVADRLVATIRVSDIVARLGGDEFAVLMPETDEPAASLALERISDAIRDAVGDVVPTLGGVGASAGATVFVQAPWSADHAIRVADELMFQAKRNGPNHVRLAVYEGE